MDMNGVLSGDQIDALTTVYLVSLTPSVVGSLSVLLVSLLKWRHLKQQVLLLAQLALADLLASVTLMYSSVINRIQTSHSVTMCQYSLPLSLTFYFISFLLVVLYAWKAKDAIQGWRTRPAEEEDGPSLRWRKMEDLPVYMLVWLIPMAVYLVYVLTPFIKTTPLIPISNKSTILPNQVRYCTSCILFLHVWRDSCSDAEKVHDTFIRVFLFLVVIPVMISCSVIYYKVSKWYERHRHQDLFPVEGDSQSRKGFKSLFSTARNMVVVIVFCWAPALLLILLSTLMISSTLEQRSLFVLYLIQATTVSLQAFLNSMVYAWRRPNFTEAVLGESTPLLPGGGLAFFDESLRISKPEDSL